MSERAYYKAYNFVEPGQEVFRFIAENPLLSVGVAIIVGIIIGRVLK